MARMNRKSVLVASCFIVVLTVITCYYLSSRNNEDNEQNIFKTFDAPDSSLPQANDTNQPKEQIMLQDLLKEVDRDIFYPDMFKDSPGLFTQLPRHGFLKEYPLNGCWHSGPRSKIRCIPGAYLAGYIKCGTSDLFDKLTWHPEILKPSSGKENYWWTNGRYDSDLESYTDSVMPREVVTSSSVILDGSPAAMNDVLTGFTTHHPALRYPTYTNTDILKFVLPSAKVIAIVRNPIERAWSSYFYFHDKAPVSAATFEMDIKELISQFNDCLEKESLRYCCAHREETKFRRRLCLKESVYICYLIDWKMKFKENFFLVNFDEYKSNQLEVLKTLFSWLGVRTDLDFSSLEVELNKTSNSGKYYTGSVMTERSRDILLNFFEPYNNMLAEFFQNDNFRLWNMPK